MYFKPEYVTLGLLCMCTLAIVSVHADGPPINNFTVTNAGLTCVVMTTGIQLTIPYTTGTKNKTATVTVPANATVNGTCSKGTNTVNIYFLNTYSLTLVIRRTNNVYHWDAVSLNYVMDTVSFPNASLASGTPVQQMTTLANSTNAVTLPGSFQCQGQTVYNLAHGVVLTTVSLQYRAFGNDSSVSFSSNNVQQCPVSSPAVPDTNIALAISVGIALGTFMVVVVVIYVIASRIPRFSRLQED